MEQLEFIIRRSVDELRAYIDKKSAQELIVGFVLLFIDIDRIHGQDHIASKHYWEELFRLNGSPCEIVHKLLSDSRIEPLNLSNTFLSDARMLFESENRERICGILLDFVHYLQSFNIFEGQLIDVGNIAFEYLFKNSNEMMFCYTPKSIAMLLTNLLPIDKDTSVFDPACGTGSFLLSIYKSVGSSTKLNLVGQEVNMRVAEIAMAYMALNKIPTSTIKIANSLIDVPNQKFDLVITEPPIGLRLNQDVFSFLQSQSNFRFGSPTRIADFNFIQQAIASLNNSGRAAIMVNAGVLFRSGKEARIRERIIEEDLIEAVISLPQKSLNHTSSPPFIILFNKNKPDDRKSKILFIHASDDDSVSNNDYGISSILIEKITTAFETAKHEIGFSQTVSIEQVKIQGFQLIPIAYVDINKYAVFLGEKSRIEQLDQIAIILRGKDVPPKTKRGTEIRIINGRDLTTADLNLEKLEARTISKIPDKAIFTQKDDVLLQRIGDAPTAFLVPGSLEDVFISGTIFLIRLHKNKHRLGRYLVEFFNSKRGQDYLSHAKSHSMIPTMRILDLRRLEIPIPDDSVINLLFDLYSIEQRLQSKIQVTGKLRNDLFNIEDENIFETELNTLVVQSQILNQSVSNVSDLFFQVRNFYPHMLAYSFRTVQSIQSPFELYKEQLRIAENILSFTGSVGLAIVGWIRKFENLDFSLSKDDLLKFWQGGISPGDWFDIGKHCAKSLHKKTSHIALEAFPSLWFIMTPKN